MLRLVNNHVYLEELTEDIVYNPKLLDGMHVETLSDLTDYAIAVGDFRVLAIITEAHTGIPASLDYLPEWWLSDFYDDVTQIKFEHRKGTREIRWCDITLDDGELLTSKKHHPLLNAFKYWLIACDNPLENGGRVLTSKYAARMFDKILVLINTILLNGKELKLSEYHLQKVNDAFWLKVLLDIGEHTGSINESLYQINHRIKTLLDNVDVSPEDIESFAAKYPHVARNIATDDIVLNLKDRVKSCCWLYQQGYYSSETRVKNANRNEGNNSVLTRIVFEAKCHVGHLKLSPFSELELNPIHQRSEYVAVPNKEKGDGSSPQDLNFWLSVIKLINTNIDKSDIGHFNPVTSDVTVTAIQAITTLRKKGRTKTLPPEFVFNLFRKSYELLKEFCSSPNEKNANFWDNMLELMVEFNTKSTNAYSNPHRPHYNTMKFDETKHRQLPQSEQGHWLKYEAIDFIHADFKTKGFLQLERFPVSDENRHTRIRNNESMLEMFNVLQGATQLLLGSIMARRQDELLGLKPFGNLIYINDDGKESTDANPYIETAERWSLRFKVKKTGIKGNNLTEDRPISLSIARFIWQLEQFNQQAIKSGLAKKNNLALFNHIYITPFKIKKRSGDQFNDAFDALCDYFETDLVEMDNGEYRRHYVRQHQLRRFFALVFFWSKGNENMEALRWMLAHSDLEHLHNYITENVDGATINSAKASVITRGLTSRNNRISNQEELDKLQKLIAKRLTGDSNATLFTSTLDNVTFDYEDESEYKTVPPISKLKKEQELENEVLTLLESGEIALDLTWNDAVIIDGEKMKSFNLVLQINKLEEAQ
ncbi:integrase [Vibrio parahaemolyticus]|uniref:integrase n=1 Tax=Vibrio parahaemolyticus TaxID=670 RepID=UPI0006A58971|nr:integrase [Vibrio parahaemolyticus]KOY45021.1 integrase [Vibrio parahaemolyticus]